MRKIIVDAGTVFNRLTVVEEVRTEGSRKFLCRCECGNKKVVAYSNLQSGGTKSCGCYRSEVMGRIKNKAPEQESPWINTVTVW